MNAPESEKEQLKKRLFKRDNNFERKLKFFPTAILWITFNYWSKYIDEGIGKDVEPKIIKDANKEYWEKYDLYAQFTAECICQAEGENVSIKNVYDVFKDWFKEGFPAVRIPDITVVKTKLTSKWGRPKGRCWHHIRIRTDDEQEEIKDKKHKKKEEKKRGRDKDEEKKEIPKKKKYEKKHEVKEKKRVITVEDGSDEEEDDDVDEDYSESVENSMESSIDVKGKNPNVNKTFSISDESDEDETYIKAVKQNKLKDITETV